MILGIFGVSGWFISPVLADGYYGYATQGGTTFTFGPSYCWGNRYSGDFFTPSVGVTVDTFIIWCNGQSNNPKVVFGIYDVIGGIITNRIGVSDTLYVTGNTMQRWTCPANMQYAPGITITICVDVVGAAGPAVACNDQTTALSRSNNSTFPKTWSDNIQIDYRCSLAAHYKENPSRGARRRHLIGGGK
ncbi:MAG: hypothetical protein A2W25_04965 [candidate division Zixibacteria bacterium RBG_16_53_22]|nr:MAG: hypothetical protein A2W25_04965 [candidate division Zixibacteria bacterium RBG_16_53_22]